MSNETELERKRRKRTDAFIDQITAAWVQSDLEADKSVLSLSSLAIGGLAGLVWTASLVCSEKYIVTIALLMFGLAAGSALLNFGQNKATSQAELSAIDGNSTEDADKGSQRATLYNQLRTICFIIGVSLSGILILVKLWR